MAEQKPKAQFKSLSSDRDGEKEGLLSTLVAQTSDLSEKAVGTSFEVVRDLRQEVNQRLLGTIDWLEASQQGLFKLVRGVNGRIQELLETGISTAEGLALGVARLFRETNQGLIEITTQATATLLKPREDVAPSSSSNVARATAGA